MKPASTSGTRHEMPRPAGVSAPLSDRPTVASSASILVGEEPAGLAQPAGVVGQERLVDELRQAGGRRQRRRVDALVADAVQVTGAWVSPGCTRLLLLAPLAPVLGGEGSGVRGLNLGRSQALAPEYGGEGRLARSPGQARPRFRQRQPRPSLSRPPDSPQ